MKLKDLQDPVPTDIEIAQAATVLPIADIAQDVGLLESEYDCYGRHKAKARPEERVKSNGCNLGPSALGQGFCPCLSFQQQVLFMQVHLRVLERLKATAGGQYGACRPG